MPETTRLEDLVIDRVDLVDAGANPHAHVLLYKRQQLKHVAVSAPGRVEKRLIQDRHDVSQFETAFPKHVEVASNGEVYVCRNTHRTLKPNDILKFAAQLPVTSVRYVYTPAALGGLCVAYPGQTIDDAMQPVGKVIEDFEKRWGGGPLQEEISMNTLTPETITKGIIDGDAVILRKCRATFPEEIAVAKRDDREGRISGDEENDLRLIDPNSVLGADERAAHLAARRWPSLYDGYVAAITRGIQ